MRHVLWPVDPMAGILHGRLVHNSESKDFWPGLLYELYGRGSSVDGMGLPDICAALQRFRASLAPFFFLLLHPGGLFFLVVAEKAFTGKTTPGQHSGINIRGFSGVCLSLGFDLVWADLFIAFRLFLVIPLDDQSRRGQPPQVAVHPGGSALPGVGNFSTGILFWN